MSAPAARALAPAAPPDAAAWSQQLQRRTMRLLLLHDRTLFRGQFRSFFTRSALPQLPLLAQYDRLLQLRTLSDELLGDILPRIRRQLSLQTDHARLREDAPTRGEIDWPRTLRRGWEETPGLPPTTFDTRLRQRSAATPENRLTVAALLAYRAHTRHLLTTGLADETLTSEERQHLTRADEQAARELAAPYARDLIPEVRDADPTPLADAVAARLRPGASPYRDLVAWWRRFAAFRVGRGAGGPALALAPARSDERADAWLYELWLMLELLHLLHASGALAPDDLSVTTDQLQTSFTWGGQRLRLTYNRQLGDPTGDGGLWTHAPGVRPDYRIERAGALAVTDGDTLIWREPPVLLDAKYYLAGADPERTHGPIKKLLGDMVLLGAAQCYLLFPILPEPPAGQAVTRSVARARGSHHGGIPLGPEVHLCRLAPDMALPGLQERLRALLDQIGDHLAQRPDRIRCLGVCLDEDSFVPNGHAISGMGQVLCPKPHVGPGIYDLVSRTDDCLKTARLCHVKGQQIIPPLVIRAHTPGEMQQQAGDIRAQSDGLLRQLEERADGDDAAQAKAEQLRSHIFTGVGRTVEQYVKLHGNTAATEEHLREWVFGPFWQGHPRALAEDTRKMLLSGEHVWQDYQQSGLDDWAAPAIQYCRALELELRRRLYYPQKDTYSISNKPGWTLGTPLYIISNRTTGNNQALANWAVMEALVKASHCDVEIFLNSVYQRLKNADIAGKRNALAHGDATTKEMAVAIRTLLIGTRSAPGVLCWLAEHLNAVDAP